MSGGGTRENEEDDDFSEFRTHHACRSIRIQLLLSLKGKPAESGDTVHKEESQEKATYGQGDMLSMQVLSPITSIFSSNRLFWSGIPK